MWKCRSFKRGNYLKSKRNKDKKNQNHFAGMSVNWGTAYQVVPTVVCAEQINTEDEPWYIQFAPSELSQIVGNNEQRQIINTWFTSQSKLLVLGGCTGTGRTKTVELLAKQHKKRLIQPDIFDVRTVVILTGLLQKTKSEAAILHFDDVQHMAYHAPACFAYLLKMIKSNAYCVKIVCCYDGDVEQHPKMSPLISAANSAVQFDEITTSDMAPFLSKVCKKAGAQLNYFDALSICQNSNGDVRAALVRLEFLFNSRRYDIDRRNREQKMRKRKRIEDTNSILVSCEACRDQMLPTIIQSIESVVKGKARSSNIAEAANSEGVEFSRTMSSSVHRKYLLHCDAEQITDGIVQAAEALSQMDTMLSPLLVDAEFADDMADAEMTAYAFRPQIAAAYISHAIKGCDPVVKPRQAKRNRKVKLTYP